jgi:hypothetical protein
LCFSNCHIIRLDKVGLVFLVSAHEHYTSLLHWVKYGLGGARWGQDGQAGARQGRARRG